MIEPIVIKVVDKVPIVVSGPQYVVCDNSDYAVVWQLDEEWAQFEHRTMQVNYKDGTYERVLFTGNSCTLPAIPVKDWFCVGLFAGDIHTTRPARLLAVRSATTDSGEERDSMPNGYAQAIKALDGKLDKNQGAENAGKTLVVGDDGGVVPGEVKGSGSYTLPVASPEQLGGVKPVAKTDAMTRGVGVDANGGLYTEPGAWYVNITGTLNTPTGDKTPAEIYQAYTDGYAVYAVVQMTALYRGMPFLLPLVAIVPASGSYLVAFSASAEPHLSGEGIIEITATWNQRWYLFVLEIASKDDIPTVPSALPNPNALTIKVGDTTTTYDGSAARAVTIPTGGSSGGETWELINTFEIAEADAARVIKIDKDNNGNAFSLKEFAFRAVTNSTKTDGGVYGWFCVNGKGTYNSGLGGFQTNYVRHPSTGTAIANDVIGRALPFGLVYDHSTGRKAVEGIVATSVTEVHEVELAGYQSTENLLYGTFSLWGVRT